MSAVSADRRDDVVRLLSDAPEGLSDGDLARALGDGVRPQTVNALCRRMAATGAVERIGTRPIRNRLAPAPVPPAALAPVADPDPAPEAEAPAIAEPAPDEETAAGDPVRPVRDVLQAWSRTVNVQAAVASWLCRRGATIRSATLDGSTAARDLVARLDGTDVHVEITGWPPDGDRTHPTTIAADWFTAATRAAVQRRGARPHARIVIALPDTRRYRALVAAQGTELAGSRTEVWFVDPTGAVDSPGGRVG